MSWQETIVGAIGGLATAGVGYLGWAATRKKERAQEASSIIEVKSTASDKFIDQLQQQVTELTATLASERKGHAAEIQGKQDIIDRQDKRERDLQHDIGAERQLSQDAKMLNQEQGSRIKMLERANAECLQIVGEKTDQILSIVRQMTEKKTGYDPLPNGNACALALVGRYNESGDSGTPIHLPSNGGWLLVPHPRQGREGGDQEEQARRVQVGAQRGYPGSIGPSVTLRIDRHPEPCYSCQ